MGDSEGGTGLNRLAGSVGQRAILAALQRLPSGTRGAALICLAGLGSYGTKVQGTVATTAA